MRSSHQSFRPPAPLPRPHALHPLDLLKTLWRNPIEAWTQAHFEQPVISTRLRFGDVVVVNDVPQYATSSAKTTKITARIAFRSGCWLF